MSPSKSILIVATALCLATLVYGFDPAKPTPTNVFTASYFTMGGFGYQFTRGHFDGVNKNVRTDFFDQKGQKTVSYIGLYNSGVLYIVNGTTNECSKMQSPAWSDPWVFLESATYAGSQTLPDGKPCDAWQSTSGFGGVATTCWRNNDLMMQTITATNMVPVQAFTTDYEPSVESGAFDLPKSCNNAENTRSFDQFKRAVQEMNVLFVRKMF